MSMVWSLVKFDLRLLCFRPKVPLKIIIFDRYSLISLGKQKSKKILSLTISFLFGS